jgi:DNA-binding HxlR family transcriptional regulator
MRKENSTNYFNEKQIAGTCEMASALAQIDGRWKLTILGQLMLYSSLRFSGLKEHIPLISEKMLSQQLNELARDGLVDKIVISQKPLKVQYSLTTKGLSLEPVLVSLYHWGITVKKM